VACVTCMYYLAFLRVDLTLMRGGCLGRRKTGKPEDPMLSAQSDTDSYYVRLNKARAFSRRAGDWLIRSGFQGNSRIVGR